MKTAGTSFRLMLQDALGMDAVYPSDRDLAGLPNGWYRKAPDILQAYRDLPPHRVLVGHFPAVLAERLPQRHRVAVFLRDPIQRALSMLRFASRLRGRPPAELLADPKFVALKVTDYQTRMLGMSELDTTTVSYVVDDATLDRALARLEAFDFVGITERFAESCAVFDDVFGTSVVTCEHRVNVGRERADDLAEFVPAVEPLVRRDRLLYERASDILAARSGRLASESRGEH